MDQILGATFWVGCPKNWTCRKRAYFSTPVPGNVWNWIHALWLGLTSNSFLFFPLLNGSLITKYHNNGKKLPRGHLGRNCIMSDHFREERLVGGGRRGQNSLEKMSCLFTHQLYQTSCILSLLTSSISSAIHCFPFFTFHFHFTGHSIFSTIFFP